MRRVLFFGVVWLGLAGATGKGPIGMYAIDERYAIVADSEFNGLLVIDLWMGGVVGRRLWPSVGSEPTKWPSLTGVASCDSCCFVYASSTSGVKIWRVDLERPLAEMARDGNFDALARAKIVARPVAEIQTSRMIALSSDGTHGYIADNKAGLFHFWPHARDNAPQNVTRIIGPKLAKAASGVALSSDGAKLFVTLYSAIVVAAPTDRVQGSGSVSHVDVSKLCGARLHVRECAEVSGVLYVVGHPDGNNAGMAVFAIDPKKRLCSVLAGDTRSPTGWRDGVGTHARFSRPHQLVRGRGGADLLLTDIDNRAVRRVELSSSDETLYGRVSTIHYDERLWEQLWAARPSTPPTQRIVSSTAANETQHGATLAHEAAACAARGAELCSPAALRSSSVALRGRRTWTSQSCHSCWLRYPGTCPPPSPTDSATNRAHAAWGGDFQMLAHFEGERGLRLECSKAVSTKLVSRLCCVIERGSSRDTRGGHEDPQTHKGPGASRGTPAEVIMMMS